MALDSSGRAHWEGDLITGNGVTSLDSGASQPMTITWKARSEEHGGVTSPEELIAAAHSSCFSMALSNVLGKAGTPATSIDTEATVTFVPGTGITNVALRVNGVVDGATEEEFLAAAEDAKLNCPVSKALGGNVPISLEASFG